jgi:hypothetical protein
MTMSSGATVQNPFVHASTVQGFPSSAHGKAGNEHGTPPPVLLLVAVVVDVVVVAVVVALVVPPPCPAKFSLFSCELVKHPNTVNVSAAITTPRNSRREPFIVISFSRLTKGWSP